MAVIELTKENFKQTIETYPFVIVDFWAPWCDPCLAFTPTFKSVAADNPDIVFGMVNIEANPEIGEYFEVEKIPGILIIREQAGIHTQIGEISAEALAKIIDWARNFDMSVVREYYAQHDKQELD
ncbi:MAG: thioredoxin family protein [Methylophilaceae bacterium]|nr:thioredoxin family protein [Methylophilaceae bacterium]